MVISHWSWIFVRLLVGLLACATVARAGGDGAPERPVPPPGPDIVIFHYTGGPQPPNVMVVDGDPANVEFGVPRSRLFDGASPLAGTLAATSMGPQTFPGPDDPMDTGMLVRLNDFAVDPSDPRASLAVVCVEIIIPPTPPTYRWVKVTTMGATGFLYTAQAFGVHQAGRRNYFAKQSRRLLQGAPSRDPDDADPADRLAREFRLLGSTSLEPLGDGSLYEAEAMEMTRKLEIIPGMPGKVITIYFVMQSLASDAHGAFFTEIKVSLSDVPDGDSPFVGDPYDTYDIVYESVDDVGPVAVVDFAGPAGAGAFDKLGVNLGAPDAANVQNALWFTNSSSAESIALSVPGHPVLELPPQFEVAFDDLIQRGGSITAAGSATSADVLQYFVPFVKVGPGLAGAGGFVPTLFGQGTLQPATPASFTIQKAAPLSTLAFVIGIANLSAPFKGGILVPSPDFVLHGLPTSVDGTLLIPTVWPPGLPSGLVLYEQAWIADTAGPVGFSSTNGLRSESP